MRSDKFRGLKEKEGGGGYTTAKEAKDMGEVTGYGNGRRRRGEGGRACMEPRTIKGRGVRQFVDKGRIQCPPPPKSTGFSRKHLKKGT